MPPAALTVNTDQAHCLLNKVSGNKCILHLLHFFSHCSYNNEQTLSQDPEDYISHLLQTAQSNGFTLPCRVQELCSEKSIRNAHWQAIPIRQQRKAKKKERKKERLHLKVWHRVWISWKTIMFWASSSPGKYAELIAQWGQHQDWPCIICCSM